MEGGNHYTNIIWHDALVEATHCQSEGKARQKLPSMHTLAGTTWWTDEQILKTCYQGTVRSYWDWEKLKTRHYALSQGPRSRPWRNTKLQSHSMSAYRTITWKANYKATPRTDWKGVVLSMMPSNWKQPDHLVLDMPVTPMCMADTMNPAEIDIPTVTICTKVPHLEQGTNDEHTKQTETLAMICEQYLPKAWINVYTN